MYNIYEYLKVHNHTIILKLMHFNYCLSSIYYK